MCRHLAFGLITMEPELTPDPGSHYGTILERPMSRQSAGFADSASAKPFGSPLASVHRDAVSVAHDAATLPPLVPTAGKVSSSYHHKLAAQRSAADAAAAVKQARYQVALDSNVRRFPVTTRRTRVAYRTRDAQQNWNNEEQAGWRPPAGRRGRRSGSAAACRTRGSGTCNKGRESAAYVLLCVCCAFVRY